MSDTSKTLHINSATQVGKYTISFELVHVIVNMLHKCLKVIHQRIHLLFKFILHSSVGKTILKTNYIQAKWQCLSVIDFLLLHVCLS